MPANENADDFAPAVPLKREETWIEREQREFAEREQRRRDESAENERRGEAAIARVRALAADNGSGFCRVCGIKLVHDDQGRAMHPRNDCPGPKIAACPLCGAEPVQRRRGAYRTWELPCGPADHAAQLGQRNYATDVNLERPRRIIRPEDEDE